MALPRMSDKAIRDFLGRKHVGVLGINREDGGPQLVPVWYLYDGQYLWIPNEREVAKVRNVRKDPRVSFCVDDKDTPHKGVVVYCTADVIEDDVDEMRNAIFARYVGSEGVDEFADEPRPLGKVLFRLRPERFYSYDYAESEQGWSRLGT